MAKKKKEPQAQSGEESGSEGPSDPAVRKRKKDKESDKELSDTELNKKSPKKQYVQDVSMSLDTTDSPTVVYSPDKKPKRRMPIFLTTREMGKRSLDRESYLKLCMVEMLIYIFFLIVVGMLAAGQHSTSEYYLSRVMTKRFIESRFNSYPTGEVLNYNDINMFTHVWQYVYRYMKVLYVNYYYGIDLKTEVSDDPDTTVLFQNRLIGRPRIRQVRVKGRSCKIPDKVKGLVKHCYSAYTSDECRSPYNLANSTAWKYSSAGQLGSLSVAGEVSRYGGGGFYLDFAPNNLEDTNKTFESLVNNLWLDRRTRAVILQFTTYNPHDNLFFTLTQLLEHPPTGGILPSYRIHVEKFLLRDFWDYFPFVLGIIFVIFVLYYTFTEIFEICYFKLHYLDYFWNICDITILILSYVVIGLFVYSFLLVQREIPKLIKIKKKHACFDKVNNAKHMYHTSLAVLFFFTAIKMLKYMNFNHSMFQMQMTLSRATKDIACFSIIFFIVFMTFAQLGHLVFGSQVRDFRTFTHSVFALLRTAVGDFDYHKIENVNHFLGPVFFFAYIFFIYFILVNMFLAIIIDTYSEVRTSLREHSRELQMCDVVWGWVRRLCRRRRAAPGQPQPAPTTSAAAQDIQNLLRRCGFTEMEIDLFFAKFDIPRDKEISQREMREKLLTNFNIQPEEKGKGPVAAEKDEVAEKLMERIETLEGNISDVNVKIDLIDSKIDNIQQIRARKRTGAAKP